MQSLCQGKNYEFFCVNDEHDISPHFIYVLSSRQMMRINGIDLVFVQAHLNASFSLQNQIKVMFNNS